MSAEDALSTAVDIVEMVRERLVEAHCRDILARGIQHALLVGLVETGESILVRLCRREGMHNQDCYRLTPLHISKKARTSSPLFAMLRMCVYALLVVSHLPLILAYVVMRQPQTLPLRPMMLQL